MNFGDVRALMYSESVDSYALGKIPDQYIPYAYDLLMQRRNNEELYSSKYDILDLLDFLTNANEHSCSGLVVRSCNFSKLIYELCDEYYQNRIFFSSIYKKVGDIITEETADILQMDCKVFNDCDFRGSTIHTSMNRTNFIRCDLRDADFSGCLDLVTSDVSIVRGWLLNGQTDQPKFIDCIFDENTKFPYGFNLDAHCY